MKEVIINNDNEKGNIYIGKVVSVLPGMQAAFVDIGEEKNAFLHVKDVLPKASNITGNKNEKLSQNDIKKYVKVGMPIIVQIKKDKIETKGARVSTNLNIPGKYMALIPNSDFITVSSKIEDKSEIDRLKSIINSYKNSNYGYVLRTAASGKSEKCLSDEINLLTEIYKDISNKSEKIMKEGKYPAKIYEIGGILNKILLGVIDDTEKIVVNNKEIYDFILNDYPEAEKILELKKDDDVFSEDVKNQIEKLQNRKIWLNCGGFITIDRTEALTAIDVNTGKFTGCDTLEKTVLKVNEEASIEIAKQMRARDIGGIVIIDYIDMEEKESEDRITEVLQRELKKDRAKTQVVGFTPLHLLEMTRKHLYSN